MALTVVGTLVVQADGTAQQPQVDTYGTLKTRAARVLQGSGQTEILTLAGEGILKGIDDINMRRLFRFGRKSAADANLVSGTSTISLASDFFAVAEVQLIDTNSKPYRTLEYLPWHQFNDLEYKQKETGAPIYWTSKNTFDDGTIQVYPIPDAGAATDYDVRVTYYERVPRVSADSDVIDAPRELGEVLVTYAEYYLLFVRDRNNWAAWRHKLKEYKDKLHEFKNSTDREPAENLRFQIGYADEVWDPNQYDPLR